MSSREWFVDRLVLPHCVKAGVRITARDGVVDDVGQRAPGAGAEHLRGTLLPGFVDLQVNGQGGRSVHEATPDALEQIARAVFAGGAVAFLPTLITAPWGELLAQVRAVARWIAERPAGPAPDAAVPLGLHVEGPFLTTPGAHPKEHLIAPTPQRIDELLKAADGHLRLVTIGNAAPGAVEASARLSAAGVTVALGHCDSPDGFTACVDAGATAVTHLFNVMGPIHHRLAGPAVLALDDARVSCPMIVDGVHVSPAMVRHAFRVLGPDRAVLVTDAVAAAGMPDGDYVLSGQVVTAQRGVVRNASGALAGSALTMAMAARNFLSMVPDAGPWTLARLAAHNPARLVAADGYGAIAAGARAAFTLLGDDGSVRCVV
ncbi:MAG: amidohydrolase family protein [Planctomycetes bacterium]|nr:amidohydrolase family protein [Planctomycetota bacterium]